MTNVFDDEAKAALWPDARDLRPTADLIDGWYGEAASSEPIDQLLEVYSRSWLPEDLLMKADKATMATSLELRTPFLDHRLVEWAGSLPLRWKVGSARDGWSSKRILREFAQTRLPREVIDRPKQGFPVPAYGWLADGLAGWAHDRLVGADSAVAELLDRKAMQAVVGRSAGGDTSAAHQVWSLLVLDEWLRAWT
jgi:asparagine synthase (glutamine-hydrolysing)